MRTSALPAEGETLLLRRPGNPVSITGTSPDTWWVDVGGSRGQLIRRGERLLYRTQFGAINDSEGPMLARWI